MRFQGKHKVQNLRNVNSLQNCERVKIVLLPLTAVKRYTQYLTRSALGSPAERAALAGGKFYPPPLLTREPGP